MHKFTEFCFYSTALETTAKEVRKEYQEKEKVVEEKRAHLRKQLALIRKQMNALTAASRGVKKGVWNQL